MRTLTLRVGIEVVWPDMAEQRRLYFIDEID